MNDVLSQRHIVGTAPVVSQQNDEGPVTVAQTTTMPLPPAAVVSPPIPYTSCSDCDDDACPVSDELTSQCTDQCVVIACNDPDHSGAHCDGQNDQGLCNLVCDSSTNCVDCHGFDAFLQCCSDYHSYLSEGQSSVGPWRPSYSPAAPTQQHAMSAAPQSFWCDDCPEPTPPVAVPQQPTAFHQPHHQPQQHQQHTHQESMIPSANHSLPLPVQDLPHKCMWHGCKQSFSLLSELVGHVNLTHLRPETQPPPPVSDNSRYEPQPQYHAQSQNAFGTGAPSDPRSPMACLWDQCSLHLTPEEIAGPSTSSEYANFLTALESHLLQDHLGLRPGHFGGLVAPSTPSCHLSLGPPSTNFIPTPSHSHSHSHSASTSTSTSGSSQSTPPSSFFYDSGAYTQPQHGADSMSVDTDPSPATSADASPSLTQVSPVPPEQTPLTTTTTATVVVGTTPSPPPALANTTTSPASSSSTGTGAPHRCDWQGCGSVFTSSDELTAHLTSAHVGGGKARYECFWDGCDRYGERGFSSKQKICRHLQSHTGHRPFQCQLCQQNFSEAATLQQHMRRHTQEKPYSCDFPGCGKSFAIMGALTIHKRIHNGLKPFKCSYCGRAFTESSNLSKHLRTHTGARPYTCTEPSCRKSFARPDQLTRHMGIHRKNVVVSANAPLS